MNQAKNTILGLAVLLLVFGGMVWLTNSGSSRNGTGDGASQSTGNLVAKETSYDFGTISMQNGKVTRSFEVKNDSAEPIRITKVYTSCMCTQALIKSAAGRQFGPFGMPGHGGALLSANIEVAPGETLTLDVIFDPAAHGPSGVGLARRNVYVETNSTKSPKLEFEFQAMVTR